MRYFIMTILVTACAIVRPLGAQTPSAPDGRNIPPLTLTGCVKQDQETKQFTLDDEMKRGSYELTGTDLRPYVGKRVQVKGKSPSRLHIVGGMWPTPNIAAQAGAIDPQQAAIAALPGGGPRVTGPIPLVEFNVAHVRTLKGGCR